MSTFDFDHVPDRRNTGSLKWDRYAGRDVLPLWVADMDFAVCPAIVKALHDRVDHAVFGYTRQPAPAVEAVLDYLERVHGVKAEASWLVWMPGMIPGLAMSSVAIGQPGDEVMTFTPVYPPFLHVPKDAARGLVAVPLTEIDGRITFDFPAMRTALTPRTKMVMLCSPHNPVGRVWARMELQALADFCVEHGLGLCSDEIHCDILLEPETCPHTTALRLEGPVRDQLIVMMAASKTYNVPGLGLSFAIIPNAETRRRFIAAKNGFVAETNPLGFAATAAAYSEGETWRKELCDYLRGNRDLLAGFLAEHAPEIKMPPLEATYLAWLDVRALGLANPCAFFEKHGLGFSDGADFAGPGFVRFNLGCTRATVEEALRRFSRALEALTAVNEAVPA
ncbi:MAG: patB [Verrucomicrobiales bacterium]|nr:patB [Verrucomicrobiales bacterium]